ncbi:MAG: hypothetical protein ACJ746_00180 [Bryobacteraceae bacterium]
MTFAKRMRGAAAFSVAMLIGCGLSVPPAYAAYIVTLEQQGNNVITIGSGTLDLAGLKLTCSSGCSTNAGIFPALASIAIGSTVNGNALPARFYSGFTGPTSFGSRADSTLPNSGSGETVGIDGADKILSVPLNYVSGDALPNSSTYNNQTLGSLGVTPGTYEWTWGSGATADSFTLKIVPVPEPSSLALLALSAESCADARRGSARCKTYRFC